MTFRECKVRTVSGMGEDFIATCPCFWHGNMRVMDQNFGLQTEDNFAVLVPAFNFNSFSLFL